MADNIMGQGDLHLECEPTKLLGRTFARAADSGARISIRKIRGWCPITTSMFTQLLSTHANEVDRSDHSETNRSSANSDRRRWGTFRPKEVKVTWKQIDFKMPP